MTIRLLMVVLICVGMTGRVSAQEADRDQALDHLFSVLAVTANAQQASEVERAIWTLWFVYDGDRAGQVNLLMRVGERAMGRRDLDGALAAFDEVVDLAPSYAEGWNRRATARYLDGDYTGSMADIQVVLALEPRHFGALSGLGLCLIALDALPEAVAAFEAALAVNPHMQGTREQLETLRRELAGQPA